MRGRRRPYTQAGISRVPCARCGGKSLFQWNICSLGNLYYGLCAECDVEMNRVILEFMGFPDAAKKSEAYRRAVQAAQLGR